MTEQYCESCKAKLIEEHRYINVEFSVWHEAVEEQFKEEMRKVGICVERVYFSGFWSQGDGAMFEGYADDWDAFFTAHKWEVPMARKLLAAGGGINFSTHRKGHYCHEFCAISDFSHDEFHRLLDSDNGGMMDKVIEVMDDELVKELDPFECECLSVFRSYMRDLYRSLNEEYDYLTSDKAVWDSILANDLYECDCEEEFEEAA